MNDSLSSGPETGGGPSGGSGPEPEHERRRGFGTFLGVLVLRYSVVHVLGSAAGVVLTFAGTVVITHLLVPAAFGRLALGLFLASLLSFLFTLLSKPGTMRRVFGTSGDEEDVDDDEDEQPLARDPARSLGTGLVLTVLLGLGGFAVVFAFAAPIADMLLGRTNDNARDIVLWAAVLACVIALYRLAVMSLWMERRPLMYLGLTGIYAIATAAGAVAVVALSGGVEGALAGTALGGAFVAALALVALRQSYDFAFEPREAVAIMLVARRRAPILASAWVIGYSSTFIVSRYVSHAELGVFYFATRAAAMAVFFALAFRMALRPLKRSTTFAAFEEDHGFADAGGIQLRYFLLMVIAVLLVSALFAELIVRAAPQAYHAGAYLIPLLAAGLAGRTVFRVVGRSLRFPSKRRVLRTCMIGAAPVFIVLAFVLVPLIGPEGAPLALIVIFSAATAFALYRSQHGPTPIAMPGRALGVALALAAAAVAAYHAVALEGVWAQVAWATGLFGAWLAMLVVTRTIPRDHRLPLRRIGRGVVKRRLGSFDPQAALRSLGRRDRAMLRETIVEERSLQEIAASLGRDETGASKRLVRALRRAVAHGGGSVEEATKNDSEIGDYLFFTPDRPSQRNARMKRLLRSYKVGAGDLHELEAGVRALRAAPTDLWNNDRPPVQATPDGAAKEGLGMTQPRSS